MKLISDAELSRKIAEYLFPADPARCGRCGWPIMATLDEGCTVNVCRMVDPPVRREPDFVNDRAMTMMLMERPDFVMLDRISEAGEPTYYDASFCSAAVHGPACAEFGDAESERLGRAVAEAFARAKGLL